MTAETDIAAVNDGGANTAAEVRTALTSVLGVAGVEIDREVITVAQASIEFASIPQGYDHLLVVVLRARSDGATNGTDVYLQVGNGAVDTASNYRYVAGRHGTSYDGHAGTSATELRSHTCVVGGNAAAGNFGSYRALISGYASTTYQKLVEWLGGAVSNVSQYSVRGSGVWGSTSAIDVIRLTPESGSWDVGTEVVLYGISEN